MKATRETDLVRACLELLALRGIMAWRNNSSGVFDPVRKVFRTFQGMKGTSDILGLMNTSGRLIAVECKVGKNKPSPDQTAFLEAVRQRGGVAGVVYNLADLEELLLKNLEVP